MVNLKYKLMVLVVFGCSLVFAASLRAQQIWVEQPEGHSISLEYFKPSIDSENVEYSFASSTWFLTGRLQVRDHHVIVFDLPFAHAQVRYDFDPGNDIDPETMFGNPYMGIQYQHENYRLQGGIRLPFASDEKMLAASYGMISDPDRMEAFVMNMLTFSGSILGQHSVAERFNVRWKAGPTLWIPTDNTETRNTDVILDYAVMAGYKNKAISVIGGVTGRSNVTTDMADDFSDRFMHHFKVNAAYQAGMIQPGINLQIPVQGDLTEYLNFIFGLNVVYRI